MLRHRFILSRKLCTQLGSGYDSHLPDNGSMYERWRRLGLFKPLVDAKAKPFSVILPPPNVTGTLHIGHALTVAIQDILVRWRRMSGDSVVWVPGIDHAGIATQVVVEKMLQREKNIRARDLGREALLKEVWAWKQQYGDRILQQLQLSGASLDWDRLRFTMDEQHSLAVTNAFEQLFDDGLIYRAYRPVNWCCYLKTAISDIEVVSVPIAGPTMLSLPGQKHKCEVGVLHTIAYPVENSNEQILVATTRVETMFGDVGIAVHPDDARYQHLRGKTALNPITGRRLAVVADSTLVDPTVGTGAVKLTPAHSVSDFECAQRHRLPLINILSDDGTLNANAAHYAGRGRFEVRRDLIAELTSRGLYRGRAPHAVTLALCQRSGDLLETMTKSQWYVSCQQLALDAANSVRSGEMTIAPSEHVHTWYQWLDKIQDWCISRQLWWGHRVPAYRVISSVTAAAATTDSNEGPSLTNERWVAAVDEASALRKAEAKYGLVSGTFSVVQDEDVLDTWFSSAILPLTAFGWQRKGDNTPDMQRFYPLSLMETGSDILFFWVARMAMLCKYLNGRLPFDQVLLHPMVRDSQGRKMSKSLGNVVDPLDVIQGASLQKLQNAIVKSNLSAAEMRTAVAAMTKDFPNGLPACGADALRFTLASHMSQADNISLDVSRVQLSRLFGNKIWNAARFVLSSVSDADRGISLASLSLSSTDCYLLSKLSQAVEHCTVGLESKHLDRSTTALRTFLLNDFCDMYLEFAKPVLRASGPAAQVTRAVLLRSFDTFMRLLHPFMPFLSETLWIQLPLGHSESASLMTAPYPLRNDYAAYYDPALEADMNIVLGVATGVRGARSAQKWAFVRRVAVLVHCGSERVEQLLRSHAHTLASVLNCTEVIADRREVPCAEAVAHPVADLGLVVFTHVVDNVGETSAVNVEVQRGKLLLRRDKLCKDVAAAEQKHEKLTRAPPHVQASILQRLERARTDLKNVEKCLTELSKQ